MKIEIIGTGCSRCKRLQELVERAVRETGVAAQVSKVEKIEDIVSRGFALTPALVIDGVVKIAGSMPREAQIEAWIREGEQKGECCD